MLGERGQIAEGWPLGREEGGSLGRAASVTAPMALWRQGLPEIPGKKTSLLPGEEFIVLSAGKRA